MNILRACLPLILLSCTKQPADVQQPARASGPYWSRTFLHELPDGTRCAVSETYGGKAVSISCDWQ